MSSSPICAHSKGRRADKQGQEGEREKDKKGKDNQAIDNYGSEASIGRSGRHEEYGLCCRDEVASFNPRRGKLNSPRVVGYQLTCSLFRFFGQTSISANTVKSRNSTFAIDPLYLPRQSIRSQTTLPRMVSISSTFGERMQLEPSHHWTVFPLQAVRRVLRSKHHMERLDTVMRS